MKRQLVIVGETIRQTDQRNLRVFALTLLEGDVADWSLVALRKNLLLLPSSKSVDFAFFLRLRSRESNGDEQSHQKRYRLCFGLLWVSATWLRFGPTEVFLCRMSSAWFSSQVRCSNMLWILVGVFHELRWPSLWSCRSFYPVIQERLPSQEGELCWGKRLMVRELLESHARCILEVAK